MPNRVTTGIPSGVTNAVLGSALETYIGMDPSTAHQYFNDFDIYTAGDWTIQGTGTNAIAAGNGGVLSMANTTASADLDQLTLKAATFAFAAGQQVWFKARFQIADATNSMIILGLQNLNTNAFAATDGAWFFKNVASTTMSAVLSASSTQTTSSAPSNVTVANATWVNVGFYYDGALMNLYFNDTSTGNMATTNLPAAGTNLALTIAVKNGTGAGQTLLLDYILAAAERQVDSTHVG